VLSSMDMEFDRYPYFWINTTQIVLIIHQIIDADTTTTKPFSPKQIIDADMWKKRRKSDSNTDIVNEHPVSFWIEQLHVLPIL
jgi:hypothetical protein